MVASNSRFLLLAALVAAVTTPKLVPGARALALPVGRDGIPASRSERAVAVGSTSKGRSQTEDSTVPGSRIPKSATTGRVAMLRSSRHGKKKGKGIKTVEGYELVNVRHFRVRFKILTSEPWYRLKLNLQVMMTLGTSLILLLALAGWRSVTVEIPRIPTHTTSS